MHFPRFLAEDGGAETLSHKETGEVEEELGLVQNSLVRDGAASAVVSEAKVKWVGTD
jgi:hypothetical protein